MLACGSAWLGLVASYMIWSLWHAWALCLPAGLLFSLLEVSSICILVSSQCGYCSPCGLSNYDFSREPVPVLFWFGFLLPYYLYIFCLLLLWHVTFDLNIFLHLIKKKKKSSQSELSVGQSLESESRERCSPPPWR
jgi:hypothetical protein